MYLGAADLDSIPDHARHSPAADSHNGLHDLHIAVAEAAVVAEVAAVAGAACAAVEAPAISDLVADHNRIDAEAAADAVEDIGVAAEDSHG